MKKLLSGSCTLLFLAACMGSSGDNSPSNPAPSAPNNSNPGGGVPSTGSGGLVHPGTGSGTHYWIDGNTGNDSNPATAALPWKTLDRIESVSFAPGDLIHIQAGVYPVSGSLRLDGITGTANAWIGIQAEGNVTVRNSGPNNVVNIVGCHYLFIQGLEITHDNQGAAYGNWTAVDGIKFQEQNSSHVSLESCRIHDVGNVGISSQAPLVSNITVYRCEIDNCYTGLYWGYFEDVVQSFSHDGRIAENFIHDCPPQDLDGTGYGIQIKGGSRGNVIEDNVLVNVAGNSRAAIAVYHNTTNPAVPSNETNVIRRNFIRASRAEGIYASEGAVIENNILYNCATLGINVTPRNTGAWGTFHGNLLLRNNTVYALTDPQGIAMSIGPGPNEAGVTVISNLLMVNGPNQSALSGPSGFAGTAADNYCYGGVNGSNLGEIIIPSTGVVQSTAYGNPNFLFPAQGSVIVDGASGSPTPTEDYNSTNRGSFPDAGAYEKQSASNPGPVLQDGFKD